MSFTSITVTRRYLTAQLTPAAGTVTFVPTAPMINGDVIVAAPFSGTLDSGGNLSVAMAANTDPATSPADASYQVHERIMGQATRTYYVVIRHDAPGATVDLSTLVPAAVPPAVTYPVPGPPGPGMPTFNVKSYGALGDGAADDTAAVATAWAALKSAGGGTLYFPQGKYLGTGFVFQGGSNFTIKANGDAELWLSRATTAAPTQATHNVMTVLDCTDFTIEGLVVDGRRDVIAGNQYLTANAASGQPNITVQDGSQFVVGEMVWVMGGYTVSGGAEKTRGDAFIHITGISGNVLTLASNLTNAYTATGADGGAYVTRYQTGDSGAYTLYGRGLGNEDAQNGLHLINCDRFRLAGNVCRNVWESPIRLGVGISTNTPGDGCTDGIVSGNRCYNGYDQGIAVWLSQRITVTGNTCNNAGWAGICFTHSDDCVATANVATGSFYTPNSDIDQGTGMALEGCERVTLTGNTCSGNNRDGIRLNRSPVFLGFTTTTASAAVGATSITVAGASFMKTGSAHTIIHGSDNTIRENFTVASVSGTTVTLTAPLRAAYASGATINPRYNFAVTLSGNTCSSNKLGAGIKAMQSISPSIVGNTCADNGLATDTQGTYGIEIRDETHGATVASNLCTRNSQDGIAVDTCNRVAVLGNTCTYNGGVSGSQKNGIRNWGAITDCVFANNVCSRNSLDGIHLDTSGARHTVAGNECLSNSGRGIIVYAASGGTTGLTIENNRCSFNGEPGIDLRGVKNSMLSGNDCSNNSQEGIRLDNNGSDFCTKNIIIANLLYDDRASGSRTQPYGLRELGSTANTLVANNRVYNNTATDLSLSGTSTSSGNVTG